VVFENELDRVWPTEKTAPGGREAVIDAFAKANNLTVFNQDPGFSVTFKKLNDPSQQPQT
jgi:hypothetical protein